MGCIAVSSVAAERLRARGRDTDKSQPGNSAAATGESLVLAQGAVVLGPGGPAGQLCPRSQPELPVHPREVHLDCLGTQEEHGSGFAVGGAARDRGSYRSFLRGELGPGGAGLAMQGFASSTQ